MLIVRTKMNMRPIPTDKADNIGAQNEIDL